MNRGAAADSGLRLLAFSSPHYPFAAEETWHLRSRTPFSLLNALRGAFARLNDPASAWSRSSWQDATARQRTIYMSDYLPETLAWLDEALSREVPNLVLIGAMSISMPGALACARRIKARLGSGCLVVLGGKHATETLWRAADETLATHPSSPLGSEFDHAFDLVVSGDGEEVIAELGEIVSRHPIGSGALWAALRHGLADLPGDYVVALQPAGAAPAVVIPKRPRPPEPDRYESIYAHYPLVGGFDVFGGRPTAHAYSYSSRGCVFRCAFCSEGADINGAVSVPSLELAADRLAAQFAELQTIFDGDPDGLSLFVEDSVFLQGHASAWRRFARARAHQPVSPFGAQLTVDIILDDRRLEALRGLAAVGLAYVFLGLETGDEAIASSMSKNTGRRMPWRDRSHQAIARLHDLGIDVGVSVLFGLGEDQAARLSMLDDLCARRSMTGQPIALSLNWAVDHPLRRRDGGPVSFSQWAVPESDPRHRLMASLFGEASLVHGLPETPPPTMDELQAILRTFRRFNGHDALRN